MEISLDLRNVILNQGLSLNFLNSVSHKKMFPINFLHSIQSSATLNVLIKFFIERSIAYFLFCSFLIKLLLISITDKALSDENFPKNSKIKKII